MPPFVASFGVWVMSQITAGRPGGVSRHLGRQLGRLHAVIYGLLFDVATDLYVKMAQNDPNWPMRSLVFEDQ